MLAEVNSETTTTIRRMKSLPLPTAKDRLIVVEGAAQETREKFVDTLLFLSGLTPNQDVLVLHDTVHSFPTDMFEGDKLIIVTSPSFTRFHYKADLVLHLEGEKGVHWRVAKDRYGIREDN